VTDVDGISGASPSASSSSDLGSTAGFSLLTFVISWYSTDESGISLNSTSKISLRLALALAIASGVITSGSDTSSLILLINTG
jgi:hypothetical protein